VIQIIEHSKDFAVKHLMMFGKSNQEVAKHARAIEGIQRHFIATGLDSVEATVFEKGIISTFCSQITIWGL